MPGHSQETPSPFLPSLCQLAEQEVARQQFQKASFGCCKPPEILSHLRPPPGGDTLVKDSRDHPLEFHRDSFSWWLCHQDSFCSLIPPESRGPILRWDLYLLKCFKVLWAESQESTFDCKHCQTPWLPLGKSLCTRGAEVKLLLSEWKCFWGQGVTREAVLPSQWASK